MQDILTNTPCKVILEDFDSKRSLNLRLYIEKLSTKDTFVLEEILYSPLKVSIEDLSSNTDLPTRELFESIENLLPLKLFTVEDDFLLVNKEMRKYFETLIEKFSRDFSPNLDYFKEILKNVPIHCLVSWFHIPRTSNNIFNSLIEKHFKTPKLYLRYIKETLMDDKMLAAIVEMVCSSLDGKLPTSFILEKFCLKEEELEEKILFLEYHFILCSSYEIKDGKYIKFLSLFNELKEWIKKNPANHEIEGNELLESEVDPIAEEEFSFIKDMSLILELCQTQPLKVAFNQKEELFYLSTELESRSLFNETSPFYLARVINKNLLLGLIVIEGEELKQTPPAKKWLETPIRQRTLITFKHPHNALSHKTSFSFHQHDRNIIEVQKALSKIKSNTWILFDEFIENYYSNTNSLKQAQLLKVGKDWKYTSAEYVEKEISFIKEVVMSWLFESGMIVPGTYKGKDCFKVTSLGFELYS
jgi:hypothetical protein